MVSFARRRNTGPGLDGSNAFLPGPLHNLGAEQRARIGDGHMVEKVVFVGLDLPGGKGNGPLEDPLEALAGRYESTGRIAKDGADFFARVPE